MTKTLEDIVFDHNNSIIEKAKKGDVVAFNKLIKLWFKRIFNFCFKYFGDHDLAMETTQKTFIALHKHLPKLRENDRLKYWLYKVALNHCHEEERKKKNKVFFSLYKNNEAHDQPDIYYHPERAINTVEKQKWLENLLSTLPEDQRTVVIMKEYEDMKFREIAEVLKISENTVKSRLYYGLNSLRKQIEKSGFNFLNEE